MHNRGTSRRCKSRGRAASRFTCRRRRRRTPEDIREEAQLLERQLLLVEELLVAARQVLLAERLNLSTGTQLGLIDAHALAVLLLTETPERTRSGQLLTDPLHPEARAELTRSLSQLGTGQPVLGTHGSILRRLSLSLLEGVLESGRLDVT